MKPKSLVRTLDLPDAVKAEVRRMAVTLSHVAADALFGEGSRLIIKDGEDAASKELGGWVKDAAVRYVRDRLESRLLLHESYRASTGNSPSYSAIGGTPDGEYARWLEMLASTSPPPRPDPYSDHK